MRSFLRSLLLVAVHLLISTLGVVICSSALFYALKPALLLFLSKTVVTHDIPLLLTLFPLQSLVGFAIGTWYSLKADWIAESRAARLVWIIPALWLLMWLILGGPARRNSLLWSTDLDSKKVQLITTLPFMTSTSYALGNYFGLYYKKHLQSVP